MKKFIRKTEEKEGFYGNTAACHVCRDCPELCFSGFAPILNYFQKHCPKVAVRITMVSPEELIEQMEKNRLDVICILDDPRWDTHWNKVMEKKLIRMLQQNRVVSFLL